MIRCDPLSSPACGRHLGPGNDEAALCLPQSRTNRTAVGRIGRIKDQRRSLSQFCLPVYLIVDFFAEVIYPPQDYESGNFHPTAVELGSTPIATMDFAWFWSLRTRRRLVPGHHPHKMSPDGIWTMDLAFSITSTS